MAYETIAEGGGVLTQGFGCTTYQREWTCAGRCQAGQKWHSGIDVGIRVGTRLLAVGYGTVVALGDKPSCGGPGRGLSGCFGPGAVCIRSGNVDIWYGHCLAQLVSCGQTVVPGQPIAYSGTLGCSTGPHVHYEVQPAGSVNGCAALNPVPYLTQWPGANPTPSPTPPAAPVVPLAGAALLLGGGAAVWYATRRR